MSELHKKQAS